MLYSLGLFGMSSGEDGTTLTGFGVLFFGWVLLLIYTLWYAEPHQKNRCGLGLLIGVIAMIVMLSNK